LDNKAIDRISYIDILDENDKEPPTGTQSHIGQHFEQVSGQFLSYTNYLEKTESRGVTSASNPIRTSCVTYVRSVHVQIQTVLLSLYLRLEFQVVFLQAHGCVLRCVQGVLPWLRGPRRL